VYEGTTVDATYLIDVQKESVGYVVSFVSRVTNNGTTPLTVSSYGVTVQQKDSQGPGSDPWYNINSTKTEQVSSVIDPNGGYDTFAVTTSFTPTAAQDAVVGARRRVLVNFVVNNGTDTYTVTNHELLDSTLTFECADNAWCLVDVGAADPIVEVTDSGVVEFDFQYTGTTDLGEGCTKNRARLFNQQPGGNVDPNPHCRRLENIHLYDDDTPLARSNNTNLCVTRPTESLVATSTVDQLTEYRWCVCKQSEPSELDVCEDDNLLQYTVTYTPNDSFTTDVLHWDFTYGVDCLSHSKDFSYNVYYMIGADQYDTYSSTGLVSSGTFTLGCGELSASFSGCQNLVEGTEFVYIPNGSIRVEILSSDYTYNVSTCSVESSGSENIVKRTFTSFVDYAGHIPGNDHVFNDVESTTVATDVLSVNNNNTPSPFLPPERSSENECRIAVRNATSSPAGSGADSYPDIEALFDDGVELENTVEQEFTYFVKVGGHCQITNTASFETRVPGSAPGTEDVLVGSGSSTVVDRFCTGCEEQ
jgi:hypothetical protein